ncbi:hypothetical protein [Kribbella ginsengisoli]|uniref:Uncharacterized protein n=1 Tax=Kribbella ginsengisoli TaxID=363865 RepID=A0ABP6VK12_9ACTN
MLTAELAKPQSAHMVLALATGRIGVNDVPRWRPRDDQFVRNDSWGASYDSTIVTTDGAPAIRGSLQYLMPHHMLSTVTAVVDAEIDFERCQPDISVPNPLSLTQIVNFFATAWAIAFDILPLALGNPSAPADSAGRPRVSLHIISEHPSSNGEGRTLRLADLVDLSPFGMTHKQQLGRLDIGVLGRAALPDSEALLVVRQALARVAEDAGFDAADLVQW